MDVNKAAKLVETLGVIHNDYVDKDAENGDVRVLTAEILGDLECLRSVHIHCGIEKLAESLETKAIRKEFSKNADKLCFDYNGIHVFQIIGRGK